MDKLLKDFEVESKNTSEDALRKWRRAVTIVKNPRRRFRMVADLAKRAASERKIRSIQEKIRIALYVKRAALQFLDAAAAAENASGQSEYKISDEVKEAGFGIDPDELASIVREHGMKGLKKNGGVDGIAEKVSVSFEEGVRTSDVSTRQKIYGCNRYTEKPPRSFLMFVWEALQDLTLIILMVCALVSIGVGIATEGWPKGMYDGLGIILSVFLVVMVTAASDYNQSLQFRDLDREKKKISIQVTRDGRKQEISIYDLVVGDVVQLSIGDIVPADGIYISGYSLVIDESSLSGESEPVNVYENKPLLLSGTKVQDGSGKMIVTAVGMRTEWGKLMETLCEGGEDETPLQVKLNGVATVIGKIGLAFAVLTFLVLTVRHSEGILEMGISEGVLSLLFQVIFQNTACETSKDENGKNKILGTPTEKALFEFGSLLGGDFDAQRKDFQIKKVEPFNSVRKKMSVLVALPSGELRAFCKGASEIVLKMCDNILDDSGKSVPLSEEQILSISDVINGFACEALRTLCLAYKDLDGPASECSIPEFGYTLVTVVGIKDPVRPGVKDAVQTCLAAGITVRMVTGDNINTAKAIAKECGILTEGGVAIEGPEFRAMNPRQMGEIIPKIQVFGMITL
ncbi:hypothetical protein OIU77_029713 [Salix suchowensis]|uniref:Cation-transporting P-type ATPase N-terminal domain-containing protein n=1 Tax=Salix suchowensis TaxID=1278906 RepID=A0ABQ9BA65_9ROSI|nr:hypothetical protein OIU77_029713 [Salix suchowensis]